MDLSLAGWSLNRLFRAAENPLKLIDFPAFARDQFGLYAVELNNIYFESREPAYLDSLNLAASRAGVKLLNIAVDERGDLASDEKAQREEGVLTNMRWVQAAQQMHIRAIRCNSGGRDVRDPARAVKNCTDSFRKICDVARPKGVMVLIENHGGISSNPDHVVQIVQGVRKTHGDDAFGTLADFGNWPDEVDRYDALRKVMPYAAATHAKVNDIDEHLNHPRFDHARCIEIARAAGYKGHLGIEYEGKDEPVIGIKRGVELLRKLLA
jgi:sugar phosphate isomerase/epimerase